MIKGSRLHLSLFEVFADLCRSRNFTETARRHYLSQPAVSQQIEFLERHFRARLIQRGRRRFHLTREGEIVLAGAHRLLEAYRGIARRLKTPGPKAPQFVKIRTIYSIGLHRLNSQLRDFLKERPDIEPAVEYDRSDRIYDAVLSGSCDVGIVACPWRRPKIRALVYDREPLVVACPPRHPLARRASTALSALDGEPFVAFHQDIPTRRLIDDALSKAKASVRIVRELDNIETLKRAVEGGAGLSILPESSVVKEVAEGSLRALKVKGRPLTRPLALLTREGAPPSPAARSLISWLRRRKARRDGRPAK